MTVREFAVMFADCGFSALEYDLAMRLVSGMGYPSLVEYAAYRQVGQGEVLMAIGTLVTSGFFRMEFVEWGNNG